MVYKLGNTSDLASLPSTDPVTLQNLYELTSVLTNEYGDDRNIDTDDGGFVLYAPPGTPAKEVKASFDYTKHPLEYVNRSGPICCAFYLLNNEFAVTIVMSITDAPIEITDAFEEGY
jgi:hypothetical protein